MSVASHLLGWTCIGAVAGCYYGWKRMRAPYGRARAILDAPPALPRRVKAEAIGWQRGNRLAVAAISGVGGALLGLAIGLITAAVAWLAGLPFD